MTTRYKREVRERWLRIIVEAGSSQGIVDWTVEHPEGECTDCDALRWAKDTVKGPHYDELKEAGYKVELADLESLRRQLARVGTLRTPSA